MPRENTASLPLIEVSNRYGVLSGEEGDADEPLEPGCGEADNVMDTTEKRKRTREEETPTSRVSLSDGEGGGRKKAV